MKILHINQSDLAGGAAIASYRLHQGLLSQGIDSKMLVDVKKTGSDLVEKIKRKRNLEILTARVTYQFGLNYISLLSSFSLVEHPFYQEADLLNFHNIHGDYFNYLALPKLTRNKPAVIRLPDMWTFTGHCSYSYDCEKWQTGCGKCPYPDTYPAIAFDNTKLEWKLKNWCYERSHLTIVCPSQWLTKLAKQSILQRFAIHYIPNGIDTTIYQPLDPESCRYALGIPPGKKVLMFVAFELSESRKGGDLLIKSLCDLPLSLKQEIVLLILGESGAKIAASVDIPVINLGYVSGDRLKNLAYGATDLFIFPTRADNSPLVLQESMASGTPIVSFDIGGVSDFVRPGETGELAKAEDSQEFSQKIIELLEDNQKRETLAQKCREIAVKEYSLELQAQRYIELYSQILLDHSQIGYIN